MKPHTLARLVPTLSLLITWFVTAEAAAQSQGSLGIAVGAARYPGESSLSSVAFAPAFEVGAPDLSLTAAGTLASLPLGAWSSQGRADVWVATPPAVGGLRVGVEAIGAGTARTDGGWTAALHGVGEVLWDGRTWGVGLGAGPSSGWIADQPSVAALHTRARVWWQRGAVQYAVAVEPTRFLGAWFTDASAGLSTTSGPVNTSLWVAARVSSAFGSKAAGGAFLQIFPAPRVALELGAGSYLPDPYQGLPRAGYVTAGFRLFAGRHAAPRPLAPPAWPALVPERRGNSVIVRFHMDSAKAVAIAGDWDGWRPLPLQPLGGALWEGVLTLPPGTYHFDLLVDGTEWVVPSGVALLGDGQGGMVGLLTVR
jgi:hypothetical protein